MFWAGPTPDDGAGCHGFDDDPGNLCTSLGQANEGWAVGLVAEVISLQGLGPIQHGIFADNLF